MRAFPSAVSPKKKLLQTQVDDATFRKFAKLAKRACNTKAGYLRRLVVEHVNPSLGNKKLLK